MESEMQNAIEQFLEDPNADNYLATRSLLRRHATYRTLATELPEIDLLARQGRFVDVTDRVEQLYPGCVLSPRLHYLAAGAALETGDVELHETERFMFQACLQGLMGTGDGSPHCPFVTTHLPDVRDVLIALGAEKVSQRAVQALGETCDVVSLRDGGELWFVVTGPPSPVAKRPTHAAHLN